MAKKQLTEEEKKEIAILKANAEMLERTKKEAKERGNKKSEQLIQVAQNEVFEHIGMIDKEVAEELMERNVIKKEALESATINTRETESVFDAINALNNNNIKPNDTNVTLPQVDFDVQYDVISLPSNGEGYKNKIGKLAVSYLTAYDENFITSPNLYRDGLVIDFLMKNKIMNKEINTDDLLSGDVDAITLFLRATSYGTDYPIVVRDPETGQQFESVVDLTTLKSKDFNLKGDENGHFTFELPLSHDIVKFKYLTRKDEKNLDLVSKMENKATNASILSRNIYELKNMLDDDPNMIASEKQNIENAIQTIDEWRKRLNDNNVIGYNKIITNRMEMNIVAVNGNYDRKFIHNYVNNMRAKDSLELRKYINENEPGIDFSVTIQRPESLGGGSFVTFLNWSDDVFLNIA